MFSSDVQKNIATVRNILDSLFHANSLTIHSIKIEGVSDYALFSKLVADLIDWEPSGSTIGILSHMVKLLDNAGIIRLFEELTLIKNYIYSIGDEYARCVETFFFQMREFLLYIRKREPHIRYLIKSDKRSRLRSIIRFSTEDSRYFQRIVFLKELQTSLKPLTIARQATIDALSTCERLIGRMNKDNAEIDAEIEDTIEITIDRRILTLREVITVLESTEELYEMISMILETNTVELRIVKLESGSFKEKLVGAKEVIEKMKAAFQYHGKVRAGIIQRKADLEALEQGLGIATGLLQTNEKFGNEGEPQVKKEIYATLSVINKKLQQVFDIGRDKLLLDSRNVIGTAEDEAIKTLSGGEFPKLLLKAAHNDDSEHELNTKNEP